MELNNKINELNKEKEDMMKKISEVENRNNVKINELEYKNKKLKDQLNVTSEKKIILYEQINDLTGEINSLH